MIIAGKGVSYFLDGIVLFPGLLYLFATRIGGERRMASTEQGGALRKLQLRDDRKTAPPT